MGALHQCDFMHFDVGILRRDWLEGSQYTGVHTIHGRRVLGWTKADFIDYYADAQDCTPVRWYFHSMNTSFDTLTYAEGEAVPDGNFFKPPLYCPNRTSTLLSADKEQKLDPDSKNGSGGTDSSQSSGLATMLLF